MIQSYKQKYQVSETYDVIIIGSGMGSLTAAAVLAKEGKSVLVLERHYVAGGYTHVFKRKGYEWDVGIHYIGEVQREKSLTRKLFDYISDGELKWADMGEVYDRVVIGDNIYDYVKGVTNFKAKMVSYFPDEVEAIKKFVDMVFLATKTSKNFFLDKALPPIASKLAGGWMRSPFLKYARKTTLEVLEDLTDNQELIKVLTAQFGDYGMPPSESSFMMHASLIRHYFSGGNFPIGGSSRIVETIDPVIERAGGSILISAEVDEVVIEGNRAVGVRMQDGHVFRAKTIISGAGLINTYKKLLPETIVRKHRLESQLQQVSPSVAHVCLYIGLNGTPEDLQLPKANYWVYPEDLSHDENIARYVKDIQQAFPVVYISFPAAKDPDWSNRYPGKSTIDIITLMPYEVFEKWEGSTWKKRGEEYEALKERIAQRLLEHLFELEPQVRAHVDYYELSTPLTTRHFVNYDKGEIYGLQHGPERFELPFLRPRTPIKNFYLTGQDVVTVGVGGALFSGLLTAAAITRKNLVNKVMR
ncbi:MAG: NAD(P)/FAD-dependent oxidoreductase [Bacteroidota bacterium]